MAVLRRVARFGSGATFPAGRDFGRARTASAVRYRLGIGGGQPAARRKSPLSDGNYYLEDLNSRNGTYLNGKLVTKPQLLKEGDEIGICDLSFAFHVDTPDAESAYGAASPAQRRRAGHARR